MATPHPQPSATSSGKTSPVDVEELDLMASEPSTLKKNVGETHELVAVKTSSKTSRVGVATVVPVGEDGNDIFISEPQHLMKKELSLWSLIGFGMEVMNGWVAIGLTLVIGLSQGGISAILYGLIFLLFFNGILGCCLAEMASAMPSAGGQYVWTYVLAPPRWRREMAFVCGCFSVCSWAIIAASIITSVSQFCLSTAMAFHPSYEPQNWHIFVVYLALMVLGATYNLFLASRTPWLGTAFIFLTLGSFILILVTCVARAKTFQSSKFVWATYTNDMGWSSPFLVVATGLINPAFVYLGCDAAVHIAEETMRPERDIPRAMLVSITAGFVTAFPFAIMLGYCIQDFDAVQASSVPMYEIMLQATRSKAAATIFLVATALCVAVGIQACILATSRLIASLAVGNAFPLSGHLSQISPKHHVPHWSILAATFPILIIGVLLLAAQTAYNAIVSCALIFSFASMAVPVACLMLRGRKMDERRWLKLGWVGWVFNGFVVLMTVFFTVVWLFPLQSNTDASNMNWAVVVVLVVLCLTALDWFIYARTRFAPPVEEDWIRALSP